jgi:uncharacterized protein (DUF4415 family)
MTFSFEWDSTKAAANQRKHGISFGLALRVFNDPFALSEQDRVECGQQRWRTIRLVCAEVMEATEEFWKNAVRNPFYRPTKTSTTVRIDSDVLAWLRSQGAGYQTRLNAILRQAMMQQRKSR